MDLFEQADIKKKMVDLELKWKDNIPVRMSDPWWRYKADRLLWLALARKLNSQK